MMKQNVLVISTSLRKNSNSEILAKEFEKGVPKRPEIPLNLFHWLISK